MQSKCRILRTKEKYPIHLICLCHFRVKGFSTAKRILERLGILHHRFSKFGRSVFLILKSIFFFWRLLTYDLMASIWEKAISISAGNLNLGCSYLIITVRSFQLKGYIWANHTLFSNMYMSWWKTFFVEKNKVDYSFRFMGKVICNSIALLQDRPV